MCFFTLNDDIQFAFFFLGGFEYSNINRKAAICIRWRFFYKMLWACLNLFFFIFVIINQDLRIRLYSIYFFWITSNWNVRYEIKDVSFFKVYCWLLAVGCWLLAVGCWLLAVGCWLLAVGCWLLAVGCFIFVPYFKKSS